MSFQYWISSCISNRAVAEAYGEAGKHFVQVARDSQTNKDQRLTAFLEWQRWERVHTLRGYVNLPLDKLVKRQVYYAHEVNVPGVKRGERERPRFYARFLDEAERNLRKIPQSPTKEERGLLNLSCNDDDLSGAALIEDAFSCEEPVLLPDSSRGNTQSPSTV